MFGNVNINENQMESFQLNAAYFIAAYIRK